jgi:predicted metalloprotease with PDZ domain
MARHYRDTSDAEVRMRLEQVARQAFRDSLLDEYLTIDRQPFLGIQMQRQAMPDGSATIAVIAVLDDTAASQAGLQAGDSIVQVDGRTPPPDRPTAWLVQYIQGQQVGDQLQLNLLRNGRPMALTATLGPRPTDLVDDARRQAMLQRADHLEKIWWTHAFTRGRVRIPDALLDEENAPQSGSEQDGNTSDSPQR